MSGKVPRRIYFGLYIGAVAASATALGTLTLGQAAGSGWREFAWGLGLAVLSFVGARFMLPIAPKVKLGVATTSLFAAVLLLSVPLGMAAGAGAHVAAAISLRRPWHNSLFNGAEVALRLGVAGMVFHLFYPGSLLIAGHSLSRLGLGTLAAALTMYVLNTGVVSGLVAIRSGKSFPRVWASGRKQDAGPEFALYSLGLVVALLGGDYPWAVPFLVMPGVVIYFALKDRLEKMELAERLRQQMEELKQTQAQLIQSARLASVGTLAAGVAHEINNPIFVISGNAELLLSEPREHLRSEKALQRVEIIYQMSQRVAQIVRSLLNFSRVKDPVVRLSLNEVADEVVNLVQGSFASLGITLERHYQPVLPPIVGSKSQVEQVMMNLLLNARDAMPQGGKITIGTEIESTRVAISFADTGQGLPAQARERLFEPFFTTKEPGKGTGLGLYISRRIMDDHRGEIRVHSEEGKGATFTLLFPLAPAEAIGAQAFHNGSRLPGQ